MLENLVVASTRPDISSHNIPASFLKSSVSPGLHIEGLSYTRENVRIFQSFSLHSDAPLVVLRGASGCGKTTLLKILSGHLLPDSIVSRPEPKGSCLVLQEDSLLPWMTGMENITKFAKVTAKDVHQHAMYESIASFVEKKAFRMSYGQRRIVELFRAIIHRPPFLYLDEPFNFLDEGNITVIAPFLVALSREGTNVVLSNHHQEDLEIQQYSDVFKFDGRFPVTKIVPMRKVV